MSSLPNHSTHDSDTESGGDQTVPSIRRTRASFKTWAYVIAAFALVALALVWLIDRDQPVQSQSAMAPSNSAPSAALEARLSDVQQINRVLREQTLALTQRVELLEQSLSGLRRSTSPGAESFKLDEAQYLLSMAQTRLELFSDPEGALKALQLADQLMANAANPSLNAVRQILAAEMDSVRASPSNDVRTLSTKLRALKDQLGSLSVKLDTQSSERGRIMSALDRYLVVRREGDAMPVLGRSAWAMREGLEIEFERAQLALERQNNADWQNSLSAARNMAERALQQDDEHTVRFLMELQDLLNIGLAPKPPAIGASLRELMQVRSNMQDSQPDSPNQPASTPADQPETLVPSQTPAPPVPPQEPAPPAEAPADSPAILVPPALL
jgi:uroporphyrin-III C-methyltransferase